MKSLRIYQVLGGLVIIIYLIAELSSPEKINWAETLSSKDKIPFGTYILNQRWKDIFPASTIKTYRQPVYNVIAEDSVKASTYIIICPDVTFVKADYNQLVKYISQGNDVLIAADNFGKAFHKYLDVNTEMLVKFRGAPVPIHYLNPKLDTGKYYNIDKESGNVYFKDLDTLKATVIGESIKHKANFIKFNFGKGSLYLVSNPKLFSNYSLLTADGAKYAATALSFLKPTKTIIVDEYYTQGDAGNDSPMRVFLSFPVLQWAYYITIFSLLAFVIFEMKRRQRIIPVIEPLTNSTLEFVTVVGQVYYEKHDNENIVHKKVLYFLTRLRDEYGLKTNILDDEFIERLISKTDIDGAFARKVVSYINFITAKDRVSDAELIELNKLIEQFYIRSR